MKRLVIIFFVLIPFSNILAGGGWTQEKNKGYFKLNQFAIIADQYFTPSGENIDITTTAIYNSSIYAEYGFSDRFTAILSFPFFSRSTLNRKETPSGELVERGDFVNSIGDTDLTLKYGLIQDAAIVLSTSLTLGIPLGESIGGRTQLLQTGDGEFNQILTIEASRSFYPLPFFVSSLIGFNHRTNGFSNEFRYGLEIGYTPGKFYGILRLYGVKPFKKDSDDLLPVNGIFNNNVEYLSLTPELGYKITDKLGISGSMGGAFYGKNILAAPSYTLGVFMDL